MTIHDDDNPEGRLATDAEIAGLVIGADTAREVLDLFAQLVEADDGSQVCWFCSAENDFTARTCGFCNHRLVDGQ